MANDFMGQILGSVFSNGLGGRRQSGAPGGLGGLGGLGGPGSSGGLGDLLGGMLGRSGGALGGMRGGSPFGGKGQLLAMLLPLAMQWVQRSGGVGAVLDRFRQKGYSQQAASWVSTGANQEVAGDAIDNVVGMDELSRLSQQLGVGTDEVAGGFAQILPEVVNQLSPEGRLPEDADEVLGGGIAELEQALGEVRGA